MEPTETLYLESTTITSQEDISCCSFITFQVYDCLSNIDIFSDPSCDCNALLKGCGSLVFVIDAQVRENWPLKINKLIQEKISKYLTLNEYVG